MSDEQNFRRKYLEALALPGQPRPSDEIAITMAARAAALHRAHDLRKFEIDNYWKRATYFWAFQLAAFTLFGLLWKDASEATGKLDRYVLLVPAGLGAITAQVGWLTAKGSKFWQENWEAHVDMLESDLEGRLTQVIFSSDGPKFSVSRINERLFLFLILGWVSIFVVVLSPDFEKFLYPFKSYLALALFAASLTLMPFGTRTKLKGWVFDRQRAHKKNEWIEQSPNTAFDWVSSYWDVARCKDLPVDRLVLRDTINGRSARPWTRATGGGTPPA